MSAAQRPVPRLWSPRLPVGHRWLRFCRSPFAGHLGASARAARTTVVVVSAVVTFYVFASAAGALQALYAGA